MKVKHAVLALYQLGQNNQALDSVLTSLETLHEALTEQVVAYLDAPTVNFKQKLDFVSSFTLDSLTQGFLYNLIKRREVHQFKSIYEGMQQYLRELEKVYVVDIYTTYALTSAQKKALEKQLIHYFDASKVILNEHIDLTLMGGLKIMYQKQSLDQTVLQQFHQMEMMI